MKKYLTKMLIPLFFCFFSFFSCRNEKALEANPSRAISVCKARRIKVADFVSGFGSLSYQRKIDLAAPQDATVARMPYREGDRVKKGSFVATLSNPQLDLARDRAVNGVERSAAALALAEARLREGRLSAEGRILGIEKSRLELEQARREFAESERKHAQQERLFSAGGLPEETIKSARFAIESSRQRLALMETDIDIRMLGLREEDLLAAGISVPGRPVELRRALIELSVASLAAEREGAVASLDAARKELDSSVMALEELVIRSPADATVGARHVEEGERVKREDKILTLMDVNSLYAVLPVAEADAMRLARGMKAIVSVDSGGGDFPGLVDLVSPVADARSASFTVRISLKDPKGRLKPGMFAKARIDLGSMAERLVLPESCIAERDGESCSVFVVVRGIAVYRKLRLGLMVEDVLSVLDGLGEDDVVVDRPVSALKEGDSVSYD